MSVLLAVLLVAQSGSAPLRKSDLVRLLSGSSYSPVELAQLVSRSCLTFEPTERDRTDFRRLGADRSLLAALDNCARRTSARRAPTAPTRPDTLAFLPHATRPPIAPPRTIAISSVRSGFTAGGGQRGAAGTRLPRAVVFEVRDSLGNPLARIPVVFTGINARAAPDTAVSNGAGEARVGVTLGEKGGSATLIASAGDVEKQVAFNVTPGPAAHLVMACGPSTLSDRVVVRPDTVIALRIRAQDGFANETPLTGLRAAVADSRIVRVLRTTQDSAMGVVSLKPDQAGTTSVAVIANGMRQYLTVTVPPRAAPGRTDCP